MSVSISFRRDNRFSVGFKGDRGISVGKKVPPRKAGKVYRHDWQEPYSYCGVANDGTEESSTGWKITRIEVKAEGEVETGVANGKWTDRYILDYE
ncbi:MAG: hypothetical protein M9892_03180 [Bacteroidetes bacterium]|nr:hypothetical protein [Bacteroidota bacterium]